MFKSIKKAVQMDPWRGQILSLDGFGVPLGAPWEAKRPQGRFFIDFGVHFGSHFGVQIVKNIVFLSSESPSVARSFFSTRLDTDSGLILEYVGIICVVFLMS